jgi:CRISPR/Cas system-associated exonuclease Cas4 (RecB family)
MMLSIIKDNSFPKQLIENLRKHYESNNRHEAEPVHVSDLVSSSCIRKQYYHRKFPDQNVLSDDSAYNFIRGESSEYIITKLANLGVAQVKIQSFGIVGRPDILKKDLMISPSSFLVVEVKDNSTLCRRLEPNNFIFKGYLSQLLYYLVLTDIENGILCIKYSTPEMIWHHRDGDGDHYIKPFDGKPPGIESWAVQLSLDDPLRQQLKDEMIKKRDQFLEALSRSKVDLLPRLTGLAKKLKCRSCPFIERCWVSDGETVEATRLAIELTVIDKISLTDNVYK